MVLVNIFVIKKKNILFVYLERVYELYLNFKKLYDRKKKRERLSCDSWFRALPTPQLLHKAAVGKDLSQAQCCS